MGRSKRWRRGTCGLLVASVPVLGAAVAAKPTQAPPSTVSLRVIAAGGGRVSDGDRIVCGAGARRCIATYARGERVLLSVRPDDGRRFTGWSVWECPGRTPECALVMDNHRVVAAAMAPLRVTVVKSGKGRIASRPAGLLCGPGCRRATATYPRGTVVTLYADPDPPNRVAVLSGPCRRAGVRRRCSLRVFDDARLRVTFRSGPPPVGGDGEDGPSFTVPVTVVKAGDGPGVIVVPGPSRGKPGIRCPSECHRTGYGMSHRIRISAFAQPGGVFSHWRNGCRPVGRRRCLVDVLTHTSMRATFGRLPPGLRP